MPKVLYVAVEPLAAAQGLLPEADQGGLPLPPPLDVAETGVLGAEEGREVSSATGWWLLLTPRTQ